MIRSIRTLHGLSPVAPPPSVVAYAPLTAGGPVELPPVVFPEQTLRGGRERERVARLHILAILGSSALTASGILLSTLGYQREAAAVSIAGVAIGGAVAIARLVGD